MVPTTVVVPEEVMTVEMFQAALPTKVKRSINKELIDQINNTLGDPHAREAYRDNLLSYTSVMMEGRFKITDYLTAVKYVSCKLQGDTNLNAYTKTFPVRYQKFINDGISSKDIASAITSYNKNRLVNLIYEQTLVPTHVLNADNYQKAINIQVELMTDTTVNHKVRSDAANSLLTHLKRPETNKVELSIGVKENSAISDLRATTQLLAAAQMKQIQSGVATAKDVAHSAILIEGECKDVN